MSKKLKYLASLADSKKEIANIYKDHRVSEHIDDLYDLIDYQMQIISEQRTIIVADKHKEAWKQYYKSAEEYNIQSRRYFTQQELQSRKC